MHVETRVELAAEPIDVGELLAFVQTPASGAVAVFLGTARDHSPGRTGVTHLEYEAFAGEAERSIRGIVDEASQRWPLHRVAVVHRVGTVELGQASVAVLVSSAHRAAAFEASRYLIDELKARAPLWKKEHWPGGAEWVRGA